MYLYIITINYLHNLLLQKSYINEVNLTGFTLNIYEFVLSTTVLDIFCQIKKRIKTSIN